MAATVSFEVYSLREGHWSLDSVYDDRGLALHEARHLFKRRHEKGVKVIKENYDDETNKSMPTTIFHEGEGVEKRRPKVQEKRKQRHRIEPSRPKKEDGSGFIRHLVILVVSIGGILLALIALAVFLMGAFGGGCLPCGGCRAGRLNHGRPEPHVSGSGGDPRHVDSVRRRWSGP